MVGDTPEDVSGVTEMAALPYCDYAFSSLSWKRPWPPLGADTYPDGGRTPRQRRPRPTPAREKAAQASLRLAGRGSHLLKARKKLEVNSTAAPFSSAAWAPKRAAARKSTRQNTPKCHRAEVRAHESIRGLAMGPTAIFLVSLEECHHKI